MLLVHAWHSKLSAVSLLDVAIFFISVYLILLLIVVSVGMMSRSSSAHLPLLLQLVVVFNELFSKTLVGGYESLRPARFLSSLAMLLLPMRILKMQRMFLSHLIVSMACWIDICLLDIRNAITSVADRLQ